MKKQIILLLTVVVISLITFTSCEPFIENKITIKNEADGTVWVNLKAQIHEVLPGATLTLNDFDRCKYEFETIYSIPVPVNSSTAEGDVAGQMNLIGGTEIYLLYTSAVTGEATSTKYTLYGSMTSSDEWNREDPFADPEGE